jgi:nucleotide-binding universal stress UspA family protein
MKTTDGEATGGVVLGFEAGWRMKQLLRVAAAEAANRETTLALVTIARPEPDPERSIQGIQAQAERAETAARRQLALAAESVHAEFGELPVTTHYLNEQEVLGSGLSAPQLLVVGAVGKTGRRAFELASASRILLKAGQCQVLVVPEDAVAHVDARRPLVVVGIGEHPRDLAVIQAAWTEVVRRGGNLELVHAYRSRTGQTPGQDLRRAAEVVASQLEAAQVGADVRASVLLSQEEPTLVLSRQAEAASLLVIGSRPGSLSGLVLGSVGRELLLSQPCPILVVPHWSAPDTSADPCSDREHPRRLTRA